MKTFDSFSFGCRVNHAEKEALDRELMLLGYGRDESNPEVYILNTCAVTHKAEREAKQHIYQIRKRFPEAKIIVTGCAATNWKKTGVDVSEIDLLIDNTSKEYIAEIIEKRIDVDSLQSFPKAPNSVSSIIDDKFTRSKRIVIKIQDGCQRFCSFCIVPYLRGLPSSVATARIHELVAQYAKEGYQEAILAAINTQAYGYDSKESFVDMLEGVLTKTTIPRVSFGSIHPWTFDEEFFAFYTRYANSSRFVHFFHIPLQSGSNKMLNLMKRGYTREEFIEKLHTITKLNPHAYIGTDVIVGFLEESDADFEDTYNFMKDTPISKFHVFRFSSRSHTAAHHLRKRLSEPSVESKKRRSEALRELSDKKYHAFLQKQIGRTTRALFLEKRIDEYQQALLDNQIPVFVRSEKDRCGEIIDISVEQCIKGNLLARIL